MLDKIFYKNSFSKTLFFGENGIFINESNIYNYDYDYKKNNFDLKLKPMNLEVMIVNENLNEQLTYIYNIFNADIANRKPGRFYKNDWFLECYITGIEKKDYLKDKKFMILKLKIEPIDCWNKEQFLSFRENGEVLGDIVKKSKKRNLDYNYDFPYDYLPKSLRREFDNESIFDSDFVLKVFGPCENINIKIGQFFYKINTKLDFGEFVIVDSKEKTILKFNKKSFENIFHLRDRENYIFQKIKGGSNKVYFNSKNGFDLIIFQKRSGFLWN